MKVELVRYTPEPDLACGEAAAVCTNFKGNPLKALQGALNSGHESVAEHASFTFRVEGVSRVTMAQITRHRMASFSVQSQRYCGADMELIVPDSMNHHSELTHQMLEIAEAVSNLYDRAIELGVPEEDARYFTLQAGTTRMLLTMNARELRHFFSLRCCNRAQWEIRRLADEMLGLCAEVAPVLFKDAGPGCLRGACPEGAKSCGQPRNNTEADDAKADTADSDAVHNFALIAFAREVNKLAHEKGWYDPEPTLVEDEALIHSEWSEALQAYRDHEPMKFVAIELVDGVLRLLDSAVESGDRFIKCLCDRIEESQKAFDPKDWKFKSLPHIVWEAHDMISMGKRSQCASAVLCWIRAQGFNPFQLMREKHEHNKTRPYRHGDKRC